MTDIFISYRRTASFIAERIDERLRAAFGKARIFLDRSEIRPGDVFPERIEKSVKSAKIVIALIDQTWISVHDNETLERRIMMEGDWVRRELELAYEAGAVIIPILVDDTPMPKAIHLPKSLSYLPTRNFVTLSQVSFASGVDQLIDEIKARLDEAELDALLQDDGGPYPEPARFTPSPVEGEALTTMMEELPHWKLVESPFAVAAGAPPTGTEIEIVRHFRFPTFLEAIDFMKIASEPIDRMDHHPRWENIFRTVSVYYSTWDIGHRPSDRDFNGAKMLEKIYNDMISHRHGSRS
jgi:pterin-4a-carbinolamine dehydratase